jgi:hypothetical protein
MIGDAADDLSQHPLPVTPPAPGLSAGQPNGWLRWAQKNARWGLASRAFSSATIAGKPTANVRKGMDFAPLNSSYALKPGFAQAVEQVVEPGLVFI